MAQIKDYNFITIPGWMRTRLNLKGSDLLIVALIYGFSQDGEAWFTGTLGYIAEWVGLDKSNVRIRLIKLVERGILIKNDVEQYPGVKRCYYKFQMPEESTEVAPVNTPGGCGSSTCGGRVEHEGGIGETPNNIYNNIGNINILEKENILKEKESVSKNSNSGEKEKSCAKKEKAIPAQEDFTPIPEAVELVEWTKENAPTVMKMKNPLTVMQADLLIRDGYRVSQLKDTLSSMHNWNPLVQKNRSAYLTIKKWIAKEIRNGYNNRQNTDRGRLDCPVYGDGTEF